MRRKASLALVLILVVLAGYLTPHFFRRHSDMAATLSPSASRRDLAKAPLAASQSTGDPCVNLYRIVCSQTGDTRDPTGVVHPDLLGEKQALQIVEDLIDKNPDWSSEKLDEALVKEIYTPKRRGRVIHAYRWVLHALESLIDRQPESVFTNREKKQLKTRLRQTELELPPPAKIYADEPDLFTKNEVYYERMTDGRTRMRVGGAYLLTAKSWFNIVFSIAHEFAHAIDPCEVRAARLAFPAYDRLTACFMANGLVAARTTRSECGADDELSETFADWLAVYVSAQALRTFATEFPQSQIVAAATNSVRDLCEQDGDAGVGTDEFHPAPQIRIDRIFGRNPEIRQVLGCPLTNNPVPQHCTFQWNLIDHFDRKNSSGAQRPRSLGVLHKE